jgi:transcriptional regulator with XRE-family HTH domain
MFYPVTRKYFTRYVNRVLGDLLPMPQPGPVGVALKRFIEPDGPWSMRALSAEAGLSEKAVQAIIEGRSQNPLGKNVQKLADALKVPLPKLLDGSAGADTVFVEEPGRGTLVEVKNYRSPPSADVSPSGSAVSVLDEGDFHRSAGSRLRTILDLLGLEEPVAAGLMGLSVSALRKMLSGTAPMNVYALYRLSRAKGVDFNYVFLGDWSALPSRLAKRLDEEMTARLGASGGPGPTVREKA